MSSPGESVADNREIDGWKTETPRALETELGGLYLMQGIHKNALFGVNIMKSG